MWWCFLYVFVCGLRSGGFSGCGGCSGASNYEDRVLSYKSTTEQWITIGSLNIARDDHSVGIVSIDDIKKFC